MTAREKDPQAAAAAPASAAGGLYRDGDRLEPRDQLIQLCLGQMLDPAELFRPHSEGDSEQDVGFGATDAVGEESA